MHEFIRSLTLQLSNVGVAPRAQNIFDQAMFKGNYNWGRRARLIGGTSIAIALREILGGGGAGDGADGLGSPSRRRVGRET